MSARGLLPRLTLALLLIVAVGIGLAVSRPDQSDDT